MLLTLALSYLHALWAFRARATREHEQGDHYIFKHHITQNVMMSVFAVAAVRRGWRLRPLRWRRAHAALTRRFWFWIAVASCRCDQRTVFVLGQTGYLTLCWST